MGLGMFRRHRPSAAVRLSRSAMPVAPPPRFSAAPDAASGSAAGGEPTMAELEALAAPTAAPRKAARRG